jgi:hypothetical protein
VTETIAGDLVVPNFHDQFWLERLPFTRPLGAPTTWTARRLAGEARRANQSFEAFSESFPLSINDR